jgi:hypothetical protein
VQIVFLPILPESPWPPPFPEEFDQYETQEQAIRYIVASTQVVVGPRDKAETRRETVVYEQLSDRVNNAVWIPQGDYDRIADDLEKLMTVDWHADRTLRLTELDDRPLAIFLRREFPLLVFGEYEREILRISPS